MLGSLFFLSAYAFFLERWIASSWAGGSGCTFCVCMDPFELLCLAWGFGFGGVG